MPQARCGAHTAHAWAPPSPGSRPQLGHPDLLRCHPRTEALSTPDSRLWGRTAQCLALFQARPSYLGRRTRLGDTTTGPRPPVLSGVQDREVSLRVPRVPSPGITRSCARNAGPVGTYRGHWVRVRRQSLEALPCFHVPYPHTFIKLKTKEKVKALPWRGGEGDAWSSGTQDLPPLPPSLPSTAEKTQGSTPRPPAPHTPRHRTYGARDDEVGLGVEVTAEDIVTVALQGFQTLALKPSIVSRSYSPVVISTPSPQGPEGTSPPKWGRP